MDAQVQQRGRWKIPFFTIWSGQALSLVGSTAAQFALVWWLTTSTGSASVLATATMVALLPRILVGPFIGVLIDRWNRRWIMIMADGLLALCALSLAWLFWADALQVWHVYVIMFVRAIGEGFHYPAMTASTSLMVPKDNLSRVAGLNQALNGGLNIVGPPLGALLMGLMPLYGVMLVDVGTAALAIVPLFFVHVPQPARAGEAEAHRPSVFADLREGLRYVWGWTGLMGLVGLALILKLALTPALSLIPLLVSEHFRGGAAQLSLLDALAGVGVLLGGVLLGVWGGFRRQSYTMMVGILVGGLSFVVLGLTPPGAFWLALLSVFAFAFTVPLVDGSFMAIIQGTVAPEKQGRVITLLTSVLNLSGPVSLSVAGPISDWLGLQVWYVSAGVLCVAAGLVGYLTPAIVNIENNHREPVAEAAQAEATVTVEVT